MTKLQKMKLALLKEKYPNLSAEEALEKAIQAQEHVKYTEFKVYWGTCGRELEQLAYLLAQEVAQ